MRRNCLTSQINVRFSPHLIPASGIEFSTALFTDAQIAAHLSVDTIPTRPYESRLPQDRIGPARV